MDSPVEKSKILTRFAVIMRSFFFSTLMTLGFSRRSYTAEGLPRLLGNRGTVKNYRGEQGNMNLGNRRNLSTDGLQKWHNGERFIGPVTVIKCIHFCHIHIFHTTTFTLNVYSINLLVVYRESSNLIGYITRRLSADSLQL